MVHSSLKFLVILLILHVLLHLHVVAHAQGKNSDIVMLCKPHFSLFLWLAFHLLIECVLHKNTIVCRWLLQFKSSSNEGNLYFSVYSTGDDSFTAAGSLDMKIYEIVSHDTQERV